MTANPELQVFEVHDNVINDAESWTALQTGIASLKYLSVLNLGDCLLETDGAMALFAGLNGTNPHLRDL
jgi:Ran GTPase-activating protein (RanGAP) involved in mRNA processing and transport